MRLFFLFWTLVFAADVAAAQQVSVPVGGAIIDSRSREIVNNKDFHFIGDVEMQMEDTKIFADEIWFYSEERRAVATGNVLYTQGDNRISADRAEMNTETRLGTFHHAWGIANVQPQRQQTPSAGFVAPQMTGQDTDVYFFGETVEKIGPKKYRITKGGFTTCVQPSPRWDFHAGTVVLDIGSYTLLRNAVLNVKNVPLFYLPILYYPTKEEGRATGFLLPTYGSTTIRGQQISNAFFWAIGRSHDATIKHDWFSKGAQGWNGEYRYATLSGDGTLDGHVLNQRNNDYGFPSRSFNLRGSANQRLPGNFRARAGVDYFSSLETNRTIHSGITDISQNRRTYGGNVAGSFGSYSLNATFDRTEQFTDQSTSVLTGSAPRVSIARSDRPLSRNSPIYFSFGGDAVRFERESRVGEEITDSGLMRLDFSPQIRYPFKQWQWFTVNSTVAWRNTFYTRSLVPETETEAERIVDDNLNRQYVTLMAQAVGPVFNRVWNTPDNGYAERFKHTIEPYLTVQRISAVNNFDRIILTDGIDRVVGNSTNYTYGINNRIYAKRRVGQTSQAQEIVNVELRQSYYSQRLSARHDLQYTTTSTSEPPSNFSPLSLAVRATPSTNVNATFRAEIDSHYRQLRSTSLSASYNWTTRLQTTLGWSRDYLIEELAGFNDPDSLDHYVNVDARASTISNRLGGQYSMNFDVLRSTLRQQRMTAFYNAQCCGIAFEYQTFNYGSSFAVPSDHRFFMSFTLAGLGNFSPFSGALSAIPR